MGLPPSAGLSWLTPVWPQAPANIGALSTLRGGGFSPAPYDDGSGHGGLNLGLHVGDRLPLVRQNRELLQAQLPGMPAWLTQVHGIAVVDAASAAAESALSGEFPQADASMATKRGAVCAIMTADCLPVLFTDVSGGVVAAAHAGWRGLAAGVLGRTVQAMRDAGAGDILAWLGPAIGPRQFEVGAEVLQTFLEGAESETAAQQVGAAFVAIEGSAGKYLADIYALARCVLRRDGVLSISGGEFCTVSEPQRFYSYRRDGVTGRQASLIWRK